MLAVIEIQVSGLILFCWWKLFSINLGNHTCHAIIAITHQTSRACSRNHCKTWKVAMMESIRPSQRYKIDELGKHYGCQFFSRNNSIFLWNGILAALSELCFETPDFGLHSEETGKIFQADTQQHPLFVPLVFTNMQKVGIKATVLLANTLENLLFLRPWVRLRRCQKRR